MKITLKFLMTIAVAVLMMPKSAVASDVAPILVPVDVDRAYIPSGFDDNDNVQVTIEGIFPDTCFKIGPAQAQMVGGKLLVQQFAYKHDGGCLDMVVHYSQTITVGILSEGNFPVLDQYSGSDLGTLPVAKASSSNPDDYLYAPVSDAFVTTQGKHMAVSVIGAFTDKCTKLKQVMVRVVGNVIEALPIAERLGSCSRGFYPFTTTVDTARPYDGRYLLHVRSLEGGAINKLVDIH